MKHKILIFILIIVFIFGFFYYRHKQKENINISNFNYVSEKLKSDNIIYFSENTLAFFNNVQLCDNFNIFKKTYFYKKFVDLKINKLFSKKIKVNVSNENFLKYIETEINLDNIINLLGNNITIGFNEYSEKKVSFLIIFNIYQQGAFFEKLFEFLEEEKIVKNLKYSVNGLTIKIIQFNEKFLFFDSLYFLTNNEKTFLSSSKNWIEDIANNKFNKKDSLVANENFFNLFKLIKMENFYSFFYVDINKLINKYFKKDDTNINTLEYYETFLQFLIVSNFSTSESYIHYNPESKKYAINSYIEEGDTIPSLKFVPSNILLSYTLNGFNIKKYIPILYQQIADFTNNKENYENYIKRKNKELKIDLENDIINLLNTELNLTFYKFKKRNENPYPSFFILLKIFEPEKFYNNFTMLLKNIINVYEYNLEIRDGKIKNKKYKYLFTENPFITDFNPAYCISDDYLIIASDKNTLEDIIKTSENIIPSFLSNKICEEIKLKENKLNLFFYFNGEQSIEVIKNLSRYYLKPEINKKRILDTDNFYNYIDPLFDLLNSIKGITMYSKKEENKYIKTIAQLKVEDIKK
ncbi:MAG TPA: hypothetical protein PLD27_04605 [bacterium]|nr:hypothetical protein [bacterium]HOL46817.1 hypothetical protein [bacterium]HPQ18657.1 hypothetical protein [bacterium]